MDAVEHGGMRRKRDGGGSSTWWHVEKRICKHTSYPRGSSSRVAVNPGTLILMRLRHVPGRSHPTSARHPRDRSFTSQKAGEFGGVYNAKCIQNLGLFTIPRHHPLARPHLPRSCPSFPPAFRPTLSPTTLTPCARFSRCFYIRDTVDIRARFTEVPLSPARPIFGLALRSRVARS